MLVPLRQKCRARVEKRDKSDDEAGLSKFPYSVMSADLSPLDVVAKILHLAAFLIPTAAFWNLNNTFFYFRVIIVIALSTEWMAMNYSSNDAVAIEASIWTFSLITINLIR